MGGQPSFPSFPLQRFVEAQDEGGTSRGPDETEVFERVLERYFDGELDEATLRLIG